MSNKNIKEHQQEAIGEDMDDVRGRWRSLNKNKDAKKNRQVKKLCKSFTDVSPALLE